MRTVKTIPSSKGDVGLGVDRGENGEVKITTVPNPGRRLSSEGVTWVGDPVAAALIGIALLEAAGQEATAKAFAAKREQERAG